VIQHNYLLEGTDGITIAKEDELGKNDEKIITVVLSFSCVDKNACLKEKKEIC